MLDLPGESHTVFLIKRNEVDDPLGAYLEPISTDVKMQIKPAFFSQQTNELYKLYRTFASVPTTGVLAELLRETVPIDFPDRVETFHKKQHEGIPLRTTLPPKTNSWLRGLMLVGSRRRSDGVKM